MTRRSRAFAMLAAAATAATIASAPAASAAPFVPGGDGERVARTAPTARSVAWFPLQEKSVAAQLTPRNRLRLPAAINWATSVLAGRMDQASLTEVQQVSALHIWRIFGKRLGPDAAAAALKISWRESRLMPNVVNDTNPNKTKDWGLFQLNDGGTLQTAGGSPGTTALRPRWNTRAAARLIAEYGWAPWGGIPK